MVPSTVLLVGPNSPPCCPIGTVTLAAPWKITDLIEIRLRDLFIRKLTDLLNPILGDAHGLGAGAVALAYLKRLNDHGNERGERDAGQDYRHQQLDEGQATLPRECGPARSYACLS